MNGVLTWASGEEFCHSGGFKAFLKSLRNIDYSDVEVVFFTHDMPKDVEEHLRSKKYKVQKINPHEVTYPIGDRHLHYWEYLADHHYDLVLHTDCRDVVFQSDPFFKLEELYDKPVVVLMDEGMPPSASGFHMIEQHRFQENIPKKDPREHPILNGGVILGTQYEIRSLFLALWTFHIRISPNVTDQAALNYLYHILSKDKCYKVSNPKKEDLCLTGEGLKDHFVQTDFQDGLFYHKTTCEPYAIVHQWDRSRFAKEVRSNYLFDTSLKYL